MAKKKTKVIESKKENKSSIHYTGKVTVELKKKNKTVNSKVLYNKGTPRLFEFLALGIAGDYATSNSLRPLYLNIYSTTKTTEDSIDENSDFDNKVNLTKLSANTLVNVKPVLDENQITIGYSATLKFLIPLISVSIDPHLDHDKQLNLVGLFNSSEVSEGLPSAYVLVQDNDGVCSIIPDELFADGVDLNDYILSLNWEMQFTN